MWGWSVEEKDCSTHDALAEALDALDAAEFGLPADALDHYAEHVSAIAEAELAGVPDGPPAAAVRYVVLGTVLVEPLLLALRRVAQQEWAGRRFAAAGRGSDRLDP